MNAKLSEPLKQLRLSGLAESLEKISDRGPPNSVGPGTGNHAAHYIAPSRY